MRRAVCGIVEVSRVTAGRNIEAGCDFCAIAGGAPAEVVFDSKDTMAFFPLSPAVRGHLLVIPKDHIQDLWGLDADAAATLMESVLMVAEGIRIALMPDGLNLINSSGAAASQTIPHVHMHLVPRWSGDEFGDIWKSTRKSRCSVTEDLVRSVQSGISEAVRQRHGQL